MDYLYGEVSKLKKEIKENNLVKVQQASQNIILAIDKVDGINREKITDIALETRKELYEYCEKINEKFYIDNFNRHIKYLLEFVNEIRN